MTYIEPVDLIDTAIAPLIENPAAREAVVEAIFAALEAQGYGIMRVRWESPPRPTIEQSRYSIVGGMGGDGDEFAVLDNERAEHLPERFDSVNEAAGHIAWLVQYGS
jgi:hypothetical protein